LTLTEGTIDQIGLLVIVGWSASLTLVAVAALVVAMLSAKPNRPPVSDGQRPSSGLVTQPAG
jgi:hypothetical protein